MGKPDLRNKYKGVSNVTNKNDKLVVGLYVNSAAAKAAGEAIKDWDEWEAKDIKLGAIAILTINPETGKLHSDEIGQRTTKKGLGWGTAIGAVAGILTGGLGLIPGMVLGGAVGAGLGSLNHKSVGISDEQNQKIVNALKHGGAALAVMADDFEVPAVVAKMADEGGDVSHYDLPQETAEMVTATAAAQAAASDAIDETVEAIEDADVVEASKAVAAEGLDLDTEHAEHVSKIVAATGLSAADGAKLHDAGVEKVSAFLALAATPEGRAELEQETGIAGDVILRAAKKLDLMRIKGVGPKYASLLLACGVDTVPELARRNPANLAEKMAAVNAKENIVDMAPSEEVTADWVDQAKALPRMLFY
jgi:uncharacterized membrane protein/predicted flap endonuclease-1-like 5' DNA nuclease